MNDLTQTLLDIARTADPTHECWLCGKRFEGPGYGTLLGLQCPECGPPEPMGLTEAELRKMTEVEDTFSDDERFTEREPEVDPQTGWVDEL